MYYRGNGSCGGGVSHGSALALAPPCPLLASLARDGLGTYCNLFCNRQPKQQALTDPLRTLNPLTWGQEGDR